MVAVCLPWVYMHSAIYELMQCSGVAEIYGQMEERIESVCCRYIWHSDIYETYLVLWCCIVLWSIRGGGCSLSAIGICTFCFT